MSENIPSSERPQRTPPPPPEAGSRGIAWGGLALVGIGGVFLLQSMGLLPHNFNWWAIFILMPAVAMLYSAYQMYRQTERFDNRIRGTLIGGMATLLVAAIFLFDLSWSVMWPVFLILAGLLVFATAQR